MISLSVSNLHDIQSHIQIAVQLEGVLCRIFEVVGCESHSIICIGLEQLPEDHLGWQLVEGFDDQKAIRIGFNLSRLWASASQEYQAVSEVALISNLCREGFRVQGQRRISMRWLESTANWHLPCCGRLLAQFLWMGVPFREEVGLAFEGIETLMIESAPMHKANGGQCMGDLSLEFETVAREGDFCLVQYPKRTRLTGLGLDGVNLKLLGLNVGGELRMEVVKSEEVSRLSGADGIEEAALTVQIGKIALSLEDALRLRPGMQLHLNMPAPLTVDLLLAGSVWAKAEAEFGEQELRLKIIHSQV